MGSLRPRRALAALLAAGLLTLGSLAGCGGRDTGEPEEPTPVPRETQTPNLEDEAPGGAGQTPDAGERERGPDDEETEAETHSPSGVIVIPLP